MEDFKVIEIKKSVYLKMPNSPRWMPTDKINPHFARTLPLKCSIHLPDI